MELNWDRAIYHLSSIARSISSGSLKVNLKINPIKGLQDRVELGERTTELYKEIERINKGC